MSESTDSESTQPNVQNSMLKPNETALVLIEYQNDFTSPGGKLYDAVKDVMEHTRMLYNSVKLLETARAKGCSIMHCPISFEPGHPEISKKNPYGILKGVRDGSAFTSGTWGADFCKDLSPKSGDLIVKGKVGLCGFASTNLDFLLRQHSIRNVILCGFLTNCCVESTMRSAYELGYRVYTVKDCMAATSIDAHEATVLYNFDMFSIVTTSDGVLHSLQESSTASSS